jgi:hypothetical protein
MVKHWILLVGAATLLAACEQSDPPAPKVDVNITIEEKKEERKPLMPKGERSTVQGDGQRFTRP